MAVADFYQTDSDAVGTLAELRVAAGLSQRNLATQLGLSQTAVSRWERALARPTEDEISSYAAALNTDRRAIADAIALTAAQPQPPGGGQERSPGRFLLTKSSPHLIYDFEDTDGDVDLSSPQSPNMDIRAMFGEPSMHEINLINRYFLAGYFERYNHLQRRCRGTDEDSTVYLIRWLSAYETANPEDHARDRIAAMLVDSIEAWSTGRAPGPESALPTGERLASVSGSGGCRDC